MQHFSEEENDVVIIRDFVTTGKHAQHIAQCAMKSKSTFFVLNRPYLCFRRYESFSCLSQHLVLALFASFFRKNGFAAR